MGSAGEQLEAARLSQPFEIKKLKTEIFLRRDGRVRCYLLTALGAKGAKRDPRSE